MTTGFYNLSPEEQGRHFKGLAEEALKSWNLEGAELNLITMRENAVFRVKKTDDDCYVMRVHRYNYHSDAMIKGYRKVRDISDEALSLLPLFSLARALTWLGWSFTRYETETAQMLRPLIIELACGLSEGYLSMA